MSKEVQMSIKMEAELREQFMAVAAVMHRPAAQILRELMRSYIDRQELPNFETLAAIEAVERGEVNTYASVNDFYNKLREKRGQTTIKKVIFNAKVFIFY
jgi:predicted transcriptional regulator